MLISEFNQGSSNEISLRLNHCVHIPRWANEILQQRPFDLVTDLLQFAEQRARTWTWDEILNALNTHPRIGEKKATVELSEQEQKFSQHEQAALSANEEMREAIYQGNVAYEKKFGFIFLIKASGLNSEQILTALNDRLVNDTETEKQIVHQQILEIALLRLEQEIQA